MNEQTLPKMPIEDMVDILELSFTLLGTVGSDFQEITREEFLRRMKRAERYWPVGEFQRPTEAELRVVYDQLQIRLLDPNERVQ
jgi:hypothetical protein